MDRRRCTGKADLYGSVFTCLLKIIIPRAPAGAGASLIQCVWHRVSRNVSGRACGRSGASTTPNSTGSFSVMSNLSQSNFERH